MDLFIRLKNGSPIDHPITGENLRHAFPDADTNSLPEWLAKFERVPPPAPGVYEVYDGVSYEWDGSVVKDVHRLRPMTAAEKAAKQNAEKDRWAREGFASWVFSEEKCRFVPPVPYPKDGKRYQWGEATASWIEVIE